MEALDSGYDRFARRWRALTPRKRAAAASAMLVCAVIALFALLFAALPLTGNGLILRDDNYLQHYPFLIAIGRWARAFFRDPLHAPMFNWSLGLGADWIGSLNYYGVGDPLTLLSALFPASLTHVCYTLLVLIRHALAALSFLALARAFGVRWRHAMVAAAAYAFSNYMIAWCALIHPMFANPVVQLPLMILGCEKRFRGERPWVLMLATAWSALTGFYFFYMNAIMLFLFALVRYFSAYRRDMSFPQAFFRAFAPFMLGVGLALPVLAPALTAYLDSARTAMPAEDSMLLTQPSIYWQYPIAFIASNGWNNAMTVPVAALMGVCAMFRRREHPVLSACLVVTALSLIIPAVGWVFNGFSYSSDRWKYGGVLLFMMVFALYMPDVERGRAGGRLCLGLLTWSILLAVRWKLTHGRDIHIMIIALAGGLAAAGLVYRFLVRRAANPRTAAALLIGFVLLNLFSDSLLQCMNHILRDGVAGSPWARRSVTSLWAAQPAGGRTELTNAEYGRYNAPAVTGTASTSVYMSIQPGVTVDFLSGLEVGTMVNPSRIHGLDGRAALEAIWNVEGMTAPAAFPVAAPYGFELTSDDGEYRYWKNALALPSAWTLDRRMDNAAWQALTPLEKQWALLQRAVTDAGDLPLADPVQSAQSVAWRVEACENAALEDGMMRFGPGGGSVTLGFDGLPDSETYLRLTGLRLETPVDQLRLAVRAGDSTGMLLVTGDQYQYSLRRRDFTVHLGYADTAVAQAVIQCPGEAEFTLGGLEMLCQPMADFGGFIEARRDGIVSASPLADVITAEVDLPEARFVCFSVPAVRGWSARIDGKKAPAVKNANALWMVEVPEGAHTVELVYHAPGLRPGLAIAALCALIAVLWAVLGRKRRNTAK